MTLTEAQIETAAAALIEAEAEGHQIGLLSQQYPDMTLDDAYAIQAAHRQRKLGAGRSVLGWKIGLTSKVMQEALGIDTPDSGVLYDDMHFADGARIPETRFIQPRVEVEIAFVLKAPLAGKINREDVLAATDYVVPALEILDTRILRQDPETGQPRRITDTISDNAADAGIVVGDARHAPEAFDLRWVGAIVKKNRETVATGLGAAILDDPVTGLIWLARRMQSYGQHMEAGQTVLAGSFISPIECPSGTAIRADFGAFGHVAVDFD